MQDYIIHKIWDEIEPRKPTALWVLLTILRVPETVVMDHLQGRSDIQRLIELVFRYYNSLDRVGQKYIDAYNSARADLIASILTPPSDVGATLEVETQPSGDPSYWLASHVLGFSNKELTVLLGISHETLKEPGRSIVPLLLVAFKVLQKMKLGDELLQAYNRSRYLLLKYYLDAVYHELDS